MTTQNNSGNEAQEPKAPQEPQPPKKQLSAEELQRRRKRIALPLFVLIFLAVMY